LLVLDGRWPWEDVAGLAGAFALAWGVLFPGLCLPPAAVLDMPLDALFVLTAALSANEGAECAGEDYRERDSAAAERTEIPRDGEPENGGAEDNSQANEQSYISNVAQ
jgi:hypothetical protein